MKSLRKLLRIILVYLRGGTIVCNADIRGGIVLHTKNAFVVDSMLKPADDTPAIILDLGE